MSANELQVLGLIAEINRLAREPELTPDTEAKLASLVARFVALGLPHHTNRHGEITLLT